MDCYKTLTMIQSELKAPKGQYNSFGKYSYRSCEDILEAVKPLLAKYNARMTINDEVVLIGDRFYIKATAYLASNDDDKTISVSAYAREAQDKKGMDEAQITGAASSYARKYALAGLFLLDDNKDPDALNKHGKEPKVADNTDDNPLAVKCSVCGKMLTAESYDGRDYTIAEIIAACKKRKLEPMHITCMEKIAQEGKDAE
jgi:hypothetical protein